MWFLFLHVFNFKYIFIWNFSKRNPCWSRWLILYYGDVQVTRYTSYRAPAAGLAVSVPHITPPLEHAHSAQWCGDVFWKLMHVAPTFVAVVLNKKHEYIKAIINSTHNLLSTTKQREIIRLVASVCLCVCLCTIPAGKSCNFRLVFNKSEHNYLINYVLKWD